MRHPDSGLGLHVDESLRRIRHGRRRRRVQSELRHRVPPVQHRLELLGDVPAGSRLGIPGLHLRPAVLPTRPPHFPGAGLIGVKYLTSPEDTPGHQVGLTLFGMTTNSSQFPDAVGDHLLYRRLSGYLGPADNPCSPFTNPATARLRRLCYLAQIQDDARFYQASGPFSLAPGQSQTIVVAYINAAPVATAGVVQGGDTKPGVPFTGDSIAANPATHLRLIDRVAGWAGQTDANDDNIIEQNEVQTTPRSLPNKALVAQAVFDAKFLLPNAPASPQELR